MKALILLAFAALALTACGHAADEFSKQSKCVLGGDGCNGERGPAGGIGLTGNTGAPGQPGASCSVSSVSPGQAAPYGGALVTCGTTQALLTNGAPGAVGPTGAVGPAGPTSTYEILKTVTACPSVSGNYREVLLVLASHQVLASFSDSADGQNTRLSFIPQGSYVSTDGRNCAFSVTADSITWSGGSASY